MAQVTIIGGHGKVALLLAPLLNIAGHTVQSVFRNPDHTEDVAHTGATPIPADIENLSTDEIVELLTGQDVVVWSAGAGGGNPSRTYAVDRDAAIRAMDAAEQAGVKRFIMVSYLRSGHDERINSEDSFRHYAQAKAEADAYLRETTLDWTILGPGRLTLDVPSEKIEIVSNIPDGENLTSRANVARVIVETLKHPNTIHKTINFTDGEADIASALEKL